LRTVHLRMTNLRTGVRAADVTWTLYWTLAATLIAFILTSVRTLHEWRHWIIRRRSRTNATDKPVAQGDTERHDDADAGPDPTFYGDNGGPEPELDSCCGKNENRVGIMPHPNGQDSLDASHKCRPSSDDGVLLRSFPWVAADQSQQYVPC
jgi:hypothetical protein